MSINSVRSHENNRQDKKSKSDPNKYQKRQRKIIMKVWELNDFAKWL